MVCVSDAELAALSRARGRPNEGGAAAAPSSVAATRLEAAYRLLFSGSYLLPPVVKTPDDLDECDGR
jgi:hypothetical protein